MKDEERYTETPYEELANGIILQACMDYRKARKKLKKNPDNIFALSRIKEVETFFNSKWYRALTNVPPERILERLRKE